MREMAVNLSLPTVGPVGNMQYCDGNRGTSHSYDADTVENSDTLGL